MKIVCAWCLKDMGEKEPLEDKGVTHGMCEKCFDAQSRVIRFNKAYLHKPLKIRFAEGV